MPRTAPPLDPSGDEARSWLRRELLHPEYHQQDLVQQVITWLGRQVDRGVRAAGHAPPLSTLAAMLVLLLLVGGLGWLLTRPRRTARRADERGPVLGEDTLSAAELRRRAEAALAEGRDGDALVDAFRALAVRQVEQGRLDDLPGATAHEVAAALAAAYPAQGQRVGRGAAAFDAVLYGHRQVGRDQAVGILALDDEMAAHR